MFCTNCGREVDPNAAVCTSCGCTPKSGDKFCVNCGSPVAAGQAVCVKCGTALAGAAPKKDRVVAALLAIFLGGLGAHMFYLGNNPSGFIRLVILVCTCGSIGSIIGIVEGIIYLTKTDEEFQRTYVQSKKDWF